MTAARAVEAPAPDGSEQQPMATDGRGFASGARVLAIGIGSTGLFTFAYLATASHVLNKSEYSRISICWSIMFVILSVIYRPIEQLLSRSIADRRARGEDGNAVLRTPALIQATFALIFLATALALRRPLEHDVFGGVTTLYWILVVGVLAYAVSYFARGWLAGNKQFALYGSLMLLESTSRFMFALAVAVGISHGVGAVGLGMAAAPFVSLCVIPFARGVVADRIPDPSATASTASAPVVTRAIELADAAVEGPAQETIEEAATDLSLRHGSGFASAVLAIMISEQTLINGGVIVIAAGSHFDLTSGLTGFVFNVFLIVRAPLQLFQAVQTSILPHLTGMEARSSADAFRRTVRITALTALGFGVAVGVGLLAIGPTVMRIAVGDHGFTYGRFGLAMVGLGVGMHLVAGTLNQALLARGRPASSAIAWLTAALLYVGFVASHVIRNEVLRVQVAYLGATALLATLLWVRYRMTWRPTEAAL